jgi:hypothetical protein
MEISQEGGIDVPGVPSPVPSQFPVAGKWIHGVPRVPCFRRTRNERKFLYSFLTRREHWERWEQNSSGKTSESRAVEQTWNGREQSVEVLFQEWVQPVDYALQADASKRLHRAADTIVKIVMGHSMV